MNLDFFIAKRIHFQKTKGEKRASSPAIKIAIAGIAVGLCAIILSVSIIIGFKNTIRDKIVGFASHIQITNLDAKSSYISLPIYADEELREELNSRPEIKHTEVFATKGGIIKGDSAFQGVVLKGVGDDFRWDFFEQNIVEGSTLNAKDSVGNKAIISKYIANKLHLSLGDNFLIYFIEQQDGEMKPPRVRKLHIQGIYNTDFENYDKMFVLTDLDLVQKLNGWSDKNLVSGIEILIDDFDDLDNVKDDLWIDMMSTTDKQGNTLYTQSIKEIEPAIFEWLGLLDMNVVIIIILTLAISAFTMISGLLIIIIERTNMIGVLKTLGARDDSIRRTFLYVSSFLVLKGMLIGNAVALAIIFAQRTFGIFKLDADTYYTAIVPMEINWWYILLLNVGTFLISILTMVGPSYVIAKISPAKSIRYE